MTLLIQREVAERVIAKKNKHSLLSLAVSFYAQAKMAGLVDKNDFYPVPKVDSAILHIDNIRYWDHKADERRVWQLVHYGFASKRKKLANNLLSDQNLDKDAVSAVFTKLKLDKNIRAEDLSIDDWIALGQNL
jgi:16S rRNA (adenine1518-N6/adenine1519-N6)-dimethyltransferase